MKHLVITDFAGESYTHRLLWTCAKHQLEAGEKAGDEGAKWYLLSALLTACLAYEAYLNFLIDRLRPDIWQQEKEFFSKGQYRGNKGKLQFILDTLAIPKVDRDARQYQTIRELENFRNLIVHGKPEKYKNSIEHPIYTVPQVHRPSKIFSNISAPYIRRVFKDVEEFVNKLRDRAKPRFCDDIWFGEKPFESCLGYTPAYKPRKQE